MDNGTTGLFTDTGGMAEDREQRAGGSGQKAEVRRQRTEGGRWKVELTTGSLTTDYGPQTTNQEPTRVRVYDGCAGRLGRLPISDCRLRIAD